jgi:hypothetical protein
MPGNRFTNAAVVSAKKPAAKKPTAKEITIAGMERLAAMRFVMKALKGALEVEEAAVKEQIKDEFVETGCRIEARPPNFRGVEGLGEGSCQLKSRPSTSALSEEEIELYTLHNLPTDEVVTVEECFRINPIYSNDTALLERVSRAIERVRDIPDDLIQKQEAVKRTIAAEAALDLLFTKPPNVARELFESVAVLAIRSKYNDPNLDRAMGTVSDVLNNFVPEDEEESPPPTRNPRRKAA